MQQETLQRTSHCFSSDVNIKKIRVFVNYSFEEEFENKETLFTLIEDSTLKFSYWLRNNGFKARASVFLELQFPDCNRDVV